jgi:hypothetical protein
MTIFSDIKKPLAFRGKRHGNPVDSPCRPHGTGLKVQINSFRVVSFIIAEMWGRGNSFIAFTLALPTIIPYNFLGTGV